MISLYIVARRRSKFFWSTTAAVMATYDPDKRLFLVQLMTSLGSVDTRQCMVRFVPVLTQRPLRTGVVMVDLTVGVTHVGNVD